MSTSLKAWTKEEVHAVVSILWAKNMESSKYPQTDCVRVRCRCDVCPTSTENVQWFWDDQIGVRGIDRRGRPSASLVTSRKWRGRGDVCRWSKCSWLAASHAAVFQTLHVNSRLPQSMKQTDAEILVQPVQAWQNGHHLDQPAALQSWMRWFIVAHRHQRRDVGTPLVRWRRWNPWYEGIPFRQQRKKLNPYHPALTLIVLMWRIGWAHNNARK